MSDIYKDIIEVEGFLDSVSDYGQFEKRKEPEFLTLKCMWQRAQQDLARQQFVCMQYDHICRFYFAQMVAMVQNKPLDKTMVEKIEEQISVFLTKHKAGEYNNVNS